jgi:hypothetical protein
MGGGVLDGVALTGVVEASIGIPPYKVGVGDAPFVLGIAQFVGIPVSTDDFDGVYKAFVTDLTGTNTLSLQANASTTAGDTTLSLDPTGATPTITGTDLSYATGIVTSAAGGVYSILVTVTGSWD